MSLSQSTHASATMGETPRGRKLLLDAVGLASSRIIQIGSQALYLLIAARLLGPEIYGQLNYAQSWYLIFFQFALLGLQSIVLREVGRRGTEARDLVSASTTAILLASMLLSVAAAAITLWVEPDPVVRLTTQVFSFAVLCRGLSVWVELLLLAHEKGRRIFLITVLVRPFEPIVAVVLLLMGQGIVALALLHVASWGIQALVGLWFLSRSIEIPRPSWPPALLGSLLSAGLPLAIGGAAMGFLLFGPVVVHRWLDGTALGELAILLQVVGLLSVAPLSLMQTLLPALSRRMEKDEKRALTDLTTILSLSLIAGALCASLANEAIVGPIVRLVLGEAYGAVAGTLWLSLLLVGLYGAGLAINQGLILRKRHACLLVATTSGMLVFLALRIGLQPTSSGLSGLTLPLSPEGTLACAAAGYVTWLVMAAWLSGLLAPLLRALLIAAAAIASALLLEGLLGAAVATFLALGAAWHEKLIHRVLEAYGAR